MKLPLSVHYNYYNAVQVVDAVHRVVCSLRNDRPEDVKFCQDMVRKFNHDWRWRLFGRQPYLYAREDWLSEKSKAT